MVTLVALYLILVIALPLSLSAVVSYRTLPAGTTCPLCRGETIRLRARALQLAANPVSAVALQKRWCLGCGWEGTCRVAARREPRHTRRLLRRAPVRAALPRTTRLRNLEYDGSEWNVLLQCWGDDGGWHGRLIFLESSGRLWRDGNTGFSGTSLMDVEAQARALSDRALSGRLREVTSG